MSLAFHSEFIASLQISQLNHFIFISALLLPVLRLSLTLPFRFQGLGTGGWLDLT